MLSPDTPTKREQPAKYDAIEKSQPRPRAVETGPQPTVMTGSVRAPEAPEDAPPPARTEPVAAAAPPPPVRTATVRRPGPRPEPPAVWDTPPPALGAQGLIVSGFGGAFDGRGLYGGNASYIAPLGQQYWFQLDALGMGLDSRFGGDSAIGGVAARAYWRAPSVGLLGLYGHYAHSDHFKGVDLYAAGVQAGVYSGRWLLDGIAGVEGGSARSGFHRGAWLDLDVKTRFFDVVSLTHYATDDIRLSVGHSHLGGRHALDLGLEVAVGQFAGNAASLYAQGTIAEGGDAGVIGGLRLYLGQGGQPLIARHRADGPLDGLMGRRVLDAVHIR